MSFTKMSQLDCPHQIESFLMSNASITVRNAIVKNVDQKYTVAFLGSTQESRLQIAFGRSARPPPPLSPRRHGGAAAPPGRCRDAGVGVEGLAYLTTSLQSPSVVRRKYSSGGRFSHSCSGVCFSSASAASLSCRFSRITSAAAKQTNKRVSCSFWQQILRGRAQRLVPKRSIFKTKRMGIADFNARYLEICRIANLKIVRVLNFNAQYVEIYRNSKVMDIFLRLQRPISGNLPQFEG